MTGLVHHCALHTGLWATFQDTQQHMIEEAECHELITRFKQTPIMSPLCWENEFARHSYEAHCSTRMNESLTLCRDLNSMRFNGLMETSVRSARDQIRLAQDHESTSLLDPLKNAISDAMLHLASSIDDGAQALFAYHMLNPILHICESIVDETKKRFLREIKIQGEDHEATMQASFRKHVDETNRMNNTILTLQTHLDELQDQSRHASCDDCSQEIASLRAKVFEGITQRTETASLEAALDETNRMCDQLRSELYSTSLDTIELTMQKSESRILSERLEIMDRQTQTYLADIGSLNMEVCHLRSELSSVQHQLQSGECLLESEKASLLNAKQRESALSVELQDVRKECHVQTESLSAKLHEALIANASSQVTIAQLQSELKVIRQFNPCETEVQLLKTQKGALLDHVKRLQLECGDLHTRVTKLQDAHASNLRSDRNLKRSRDTFD